MQLATVFLFIACLQVSAGVYAQKITISEKNASLETIFKEIKKQTNYSFIYAKEDMRKASSVTIRMSNADIRAVLDRCFFRQPLTYVIKNNIIVVRPGPPPPAAGPAPQHEVAGHVTDSATGAPLPGVSVQVKGTTSGAITDKNGMYRLAAAEGAVLVFSYLGYNRKEIVLNGRTEINAALSPVVTGLDQLVVVGYGKQKMKDISGAVTVLSEDDFNKGVVQTAAGLLQGKVAGLTVTTGSGDVTSGQTMRLRGVSSLTGSSAPFIVIDGVPGMDLNAVAPQDIQSISILKDASSAAIYGSRSASGVILITTKKGQAGKNRVRFNSYIAADRVANKPRVLSADDWRNYTREQGLDVAGLDKGGNTDWFDAIMRTGISRNHFLSVSGGGKNGNYRASLNYLNRKGIMKDNSLERYNALFSLDQAMLNNRLDLTFTVGTVQADYHPSNSYNSSLAYNMIPVYPVKNPDGSWFETLEFGQGNPVHNIAENAYLHKSNLQYANLKGDLHLLEGLTLSVSLFKQRKTDDQSTYEATTTPAGRGSSGYAYRGNEVWDKDLLEFTARYSTRIGAGEITILGGYSYEDNRYQSESAQNRGFISDVFGYNNLSAGENLFSDDVNSYKDMSRLISYFGRLNYSFRGKYIFTGTFRRDGSSIFGENNKWGAFPSASIAWRISEEPFMKSTTFVNELKLRMGYGVVGNQDGIGPYNSIALYGRSDEYWDNGEWRNSYRYSQNANPNLQWEQTASFNPGIDYALFNGRLRGSVDYYIKKTSNLLYTYSVPVPPYLYPTMLANVGDMVNKGFEVLINAGLIRNKDLQWTVALNFAHNKNRLTRLSNDIYSTSSIKTGTVSPRGSSGTTSHIIEEGREVGTFYGWRSDGLDAAGKYIIEDINDDGEIDDADRTYIGHALPDLTYGISNTVTYRKFTFNVFFRGVHGNDVLNSPSLQYGNVQWLPGSNVLKSALTNGVHDAPKFSSYYIERGSFLRLDNMSLAYDCNLLPSWGVTGCRIYGSVQNLFVITGYKGLDPEVEMGGLAPGVEEAAFIPKAKTFSLGINISF